MRARENEAMKFKVAGMTLEQIAAHQGCDQSTVSRRVKRALDRATFEGATAMRRLEAERLEENHRGLQALIHAQGTTSSEKIQARRAIVLNSARKARLYGLDSPEVIRFEVRMNQVLEALRTNVSEEDFERIAGCLISAASERAPGEEPRGEADPGSALPN